MKYIGSPTRRLEDPRLIRGEGQFSGDLRLEGLLQLAVARSPHAHATIASIELKEASNSPGVLLVWTADHLPATARHMSTTLPAEVAAYRRPVLAPEAVHYVGEGFALVVAEDRYQASDGVEAIVANWETLPVVTDASAAMAPGAALVHEAHGTNLARKAVYQFGDITAAFANAAVTVKQRLSTSRVCAMAMEPRAVTAQFDPRTGRLTVWTSTQGVFMVREELARLLGLELSQIDVIAHDVGGGFGAKGLVYPEEVLVPLAAMELRRPVQWVANRTEDTATSVHGHGTILDLEMAATDSGEVLGLRGSILHDLGPYAAPGYDQPDNIVPHLVSAYRLPAFSVEASVVFTNGAPTGFIRGGSRPLGNFGIERMIDRLARKLRREPTEIRRSNLIRHGSTPHDTRFPKGSATIRYDRSDYEGLLDRALKELDYGRWRGEQESSTQNLGIGVACCVESSGYGNREPSRVQVNADGSVTVSIGATSQGQGHATMAAVVLAERLGWPLDRITVVVGDTRGVADRASLTAGSRTAIHVGNSVSIAARLVREELLRRAAEVLEVAPDDLVLSEGIISVAGMPSRSVGAADIIGEEPLVISAAFETSTPYAYPASCHAVVIAIDPELGTIEILRYVIVNDNGTVINPVTLDGQLVGGYVHGLGYALFEEAVVGSDGGLLTASFLDYLIPSLPDISIEPLRFHLDSPSEFNPEGIKGAGESGTVPVAGAIANAVEDALLHAGGYGVVDRLPLTPEYVRSLFAGLGSRVPGTVLA